MLKFLQLVVLISITASIGNAFEIKDGPFVIGDRVKPDASAIFQVESTTHGFASPRMTTVQRDAIASPLEGLMLFNTNTTTLQIYSGGSWTSIGGGGSDHPLWLVSTGYGIGAIIVDSLTFKVYRANTGHVSDATLFATDLALGYWDELSDDLNRLTISVDNTLPRFDGITGDLIQSSAVTISDTDIMGSLVGLSIGAAAPVASSLLDTVSTTQGARPCPNMTEAQRDVIGAPAAGLCVFNTDTNKLNIYNISTTSWEAAGGGVNKWLTATSYKIDDVIWETASNNIYRATTGHTSGVFLTDIANWTELTNDISVIGTPTYTKIKDLHKVSLSTSVINHVVFTDNSDGTIDVAAVDGLIRATDSDVAELLSFSLGITSSLALVDLDTNWIYVEYNAGTPQVVATITERTDYNTNVLLGKVFRTGTLAHINDKEHIHGGNIPSLLNQRFFATEPYERESGALLSETGTRNFAITAGKFWHGLDTYTTSAFDSSGADSFSYWYVTTGTWTEIAAQSQIDNLQYNDPATGLQTLSNNKYGTHWVYLETDSHVMVVYGQGDFSLAEAIAAQPDGVPEDISSHGRLIGKIIIQKNSATFYSIESSFDQVFTSSGVTDHNNLTTLQGGAASEYYHLDATEFGFLDGQDQSVLTTSSPTFKNISGEGFNILGNNPYKQFNKSAYAEHSTIAGDISTGQNATFDGGGTITAGEPSIEVGALDTTDASFYQYDMGTLNDYWYHTVVVDNNKKIGYRFRYSYDGADDDIEPQIKCSTSGTILTDTSPIFFPKSDDLTTFTGSLFVPSGCGDLKFGFSVTTLNAGKVFKYNRITHTDNPNVNKNLAVIEQGNWDAFAGYSTNNIAVPYLTNERNNTISALGTITNTSADGFFFTANRKVRFSGSATLYRAVGSPVIWGWSINTSATNLDIAANLVAGGVIHGGTVRIDGSSGNAPDNSVEVELEAGDKIYLHSNLTALDANVYYGVSVLVEALDDYVIHASEKREEWQSYTPTVQGFGGTPTDISSVEFFYQRVGDSVNIRGRFTTGTVAANEARISLPAGLTSDSSKIDTTFHNVGKARRAQAGDFDTTVAIEPSATYMVFTLQDPTNHAGTKQNGNNLIASSTEMIVEANGIPIQGWTGVSQHYVVVPTDELETFSGWKSYNPTIVGFGSPTNKEFFWRRVGDTMEIQGKFQSGSPTATEAQIPLPNSKVIDQGNEHSVGTYFFSRTSTEHGGSILATSGDAYLNMSARTCFSGTSSPCTAVTNGSSITVTSSDKIIFSARVKIQGWTTATGIVTGTFAKIRTAYVKEVQASGTGGTTSLVTATWVKNVLNSITGDSSFVSIAASVVTIQPGKYKIKSYIPVSVNSTSNTVCRFQSRLRNTTTPATTMVSNGHISRGAGTAAGHIALSNIMMEGNINITVATNYEVQTYLNTTTNCGAAIGTAVSTGENEVATQLEITQILAR